MKMVMLVAGSIFSTRSMPRSFLVLCLCFLAVGCTTLPKVQKEQALGIKKVALVGISIGEGERVESWRMSQHINLDKIDEQFKVDLSKSLGWTFSNQDDVSRNDIYQEVLKKQKTAFLRGSDASKPNVNFVKNEKMLDYSEVTYNLSAADRNALLKTLDADAIVAFEISFQTDEDSYLELASVKFKDLKPIISLRVSAYRAGQEHPFWFDQIQIDSKSGVPLTSFSYDISKRNELFAQATGSAVETIVSRYQKAISP